MSKLKPFNIIAILSFLVIVTLHQVKINHQWYHFFVNLGFEIFLTTLVLFVTSTQINNTKEKFNRLFWLLFALSFVSLLLFSLLSQLNDEVGQPQEKSLQSQIGFFLYAVFMITAIEIKSYSKANETLNLKSAVTALGLFSFLVGSFTYFILIPNSFHSIEEGQFLRSRNILVFQLLIDGYLVLRWLHLGLQLNFRNNGFLLFFALASIFWAIVHFNQSLLFLSVSTDSFRLPNWIGYIPYYCFIFGVSITAVRPQEKPIKKSLSRYHLLNSPLFFLALISIFFSTDSFMPIEMLQSSEVQRAKITWMSITTILAALQILELFKTNRQRKTQLGQARALNDSIVSQLEKKTIELKQQTSTNQVLLNTISNPILTVKPNGEIVSMNAATSLLLGYEEKDLLGSKFSDLIPNTEELSFIFEYHSYQQKMKRSNQAIELESIILSKEEVEIFVHATISRTTINRKNLLIISLADIRHQKEMEKQLHQLKDEFTANISHEFRTPLTIVNGIVDDLLQNAEDKKSIDALKIAKRNNLRLIHMVDQLMEISRIESESIVISDVDVSDLVLPICESYRTLAADKNIEYGTTLCKTVHINGNQSAFENILYNLLSNAFKYTLPGASVNVLLSESQFGYQLVIADTGIGISKEQQSKVFDRFQRVDTNNKISAPGTGIGLSLVRDLVDRMGWKLDLESTPNKGTKITIGIKKSTTRLTPKVRNKNEVLKTNDIFLLEQEIRSATDITNISKSRNLVLVIEDNSDMRHHLENIISPHHQCITAIDGEQGIHMADEFLPDIIVSDIMMPRINGFAVLENIRQKLSTTHIPVILLTAKTDQKSKLKGLSYEADDYLTKPFDAEELLLRISNLLRVRKKLQQKYESQWHGYAKIDGSTDTEAENYFLFKLNEFFRENFQNPELSMNSLAIELSMSERQLQRKTKALVDLSPLELLKRFRLEKAKVQLKDNKQIGLVAQNCGFSSQTYFGRCFKEHFGITPRNYQQQE